MVKETRHTFFCMSTGQMTLYQERNVPREENTIQWYLMQAVEWFKNIS